MALEVGAWAAHTSSLACLTCSARRSIVGATTWVWTIDGLSRTSWPSTVKGISLEIHTSTPSLPAAVAGEQKQV